VTPWNASILFPRTSKKRDFFHGQHNSWERLQRNTHSKEEAYEDRGLQKSPH
jgi:hypothetical protein